LFRSSSARCAYDVFQGSRSAPASDRAPVFRGFNTQLRLTDLHASHLDEAAFVRLVDALAAERIPAPVIRVKLEPSEHLTSEHCPTPDRCRFPKIERLRAPLAYARRHGVTVILVLTNPQWLTTCTPPAPTHAGWITQVSPDAYLQVMRAVVTDVHRYLGDLFAHWNLFNEADFRAFDSYRLVAAGQQAAYRRCAAPVFRALSRQIKALQPQATVLTDLAGTPIPPHPRQYKFLRAVQGSIDAIGLNLYTQGDSQAIARLPAKIATVQRLFHKPIWITEFGVCTARVAHDRQAAVLSRYLEAFTRIPLAGLIVYQYQDDLTSWYAEPCRQTYGIVNGAGQAKHAYRPVMAGLRHFPQPAPLPSSAPAEKSE
jgi:hypothetical protein